MSEPAHPDLDELDREIELELAAFEAAERVRLELPAEDGPAQWRERPTRPFTRSQREETTLLHRGLTLAQDEFIISGLRGIGYRAQVLDVPDVESLRYGKEFGNRGQCNPTYFTVGNLLKFLCTLRERGMSTAKIIEKYIFVTAGACGPCRFGTYVTEYRKALRDAGFEGFRVFLFQQKGGFRQATGADLGLQLSPAFFYVLTRAAVVGDVLNALGYRIRPYEVTPGATDAALLRCKRWIQQALERRRPLLPALLRCRRELGTVRVDRTRIKPKVAIIGEFWAMTTEGDGNYQMQRFLESEGAEVESQLCTAWLLYMLWCVRWDTEKRASLHGTDEGRHGLRGVAVRKRLLTVTLSEKLLRAFFRGVARTMGLHRYELPDMDELAAVSHAFYDNQLRGGEGHMEVGKLILNVAKSKVNMTLSIKPFGCMPSSSVSDGIQSLITEMFPEGIFLPIETSGDGAVGVQSRVQMQLFKARRIARKEVEKALRETGQTVEAVAAYLRHHPRLRYALHQAKHHAGCTAADVVYEVAAHRRTLSQKLARLAKDRLRTRRPGKVSDLVAKARRAAERRAPPRVASVS